MTDFFDILVLSRDFAFDGKTLAAAIAATFERRKTDIPAEIPLALTDEFARDSVKLAQWSAFLRKSGLDSGPEDLESVLDRLREFLLLPLEEAAGTRKDLSSWPPGGPWSVAAPE